MRGLSFTIILLLAALGSALTGQSSSSSSPSSDSSPSAAGGGDPSAPSSLYVIRPSDVLQVQVYQEPDLDSTVRVDADGKITLPLIGSIAVGGKTVAETQELLHLLYKGDYLINPHITILMVYYAERRVLVNGQVHSPGEVMFPPEEEMTLTHAIARARGTTRLASSTVTIRRMQADGKAVTFTVNYDRILRNADAKDPKLEKGDIITVGERHI